RRVWFSLRRPSLPGPCVPPQHEPEPPPLLADELALPPRPCAARPLPPPCGELLLRPADELLLPAGELLLPPPDALALQPMPASRRCVVGAPPHGRSLPCQLHRRS